MTLQALRTRRLLPVVALAICAASPASAAWPSDPYVNVPLCTAAISQEYPVGVPDGAGGAIVTWQDLRGIATVYDIYAQRISAAGMVLWTTNGVPVCAATGDQRNPIIVADGTGGAVIAWADARSGTNAIYAQRISAAGAVQWTANGVILAVAGGIQSLPTLAADGAGGAFFAWQDYRSGNYDLYAQHVSAAGAVLWTSGGAALCTAADDQYDPTIASDGAGGAIAAWRDYRGTYTDIYAQRVAAGGTAQWTANGVPLCAAAGTQESPVIVADAAGGAIVAWEDGRSGTNDIYAQRVLASGTVQWTANGVALCTAIGGQYDPAIASDGAGGAIVVWDDMRGATGVYAQRISAAGAAQWTSDGAAVCTGDLELRHPAIASDGAGGAIVAWQDSCNGKDNVDIYAQRISAAGAARWTANGVALCRAASYQYSPSVAANGTGGAVVSWMDIRSGTWHIYAQRVDRWGYLGSQFTITGVHDVPADEGGHVLVDWTRSPLDTMPGLPITAYYLWRQAPRSAAQAALVGGARLIAEGVTPADNPRGLFRASVLGGLTYYWEYMGSAAATGAAAYSASVATAGDSTATGNPRTLFMVEALTSTAGQYWVSDPDSGYSVDNLAPAPPTAFLGAYANGAATLSWDASPAADLAGYRLHRGSTAEFVPGDGNLVAATTGTGYADIAGSPYCYRLAAVDVHGNLSPYAFLQPGGTVGVPSGALPRELALSRPAPNPLRGSTTLRLALPREARVSLAIYDQQGRRVRTLVAGPQPAGEHPLIWDGRDDGGRGVSSGIYFARLECEGRTFTRRIAAIR